MRRVKVFMVLCIAVLVGRELRWVWRAVSGEFEHGSGSDERRSSIQHMSIYVKK